MLAPGDLLLCSAGSLDVFHLFTSVEPACYAGYLTRFRASREKADPRFISYAAGSAPFRLQVASKAVRSTIDNYSAAKYANTYIAAPWDVSTQQVIADFLDRECHKIASLIAEFSALRIGVLQDHQVAISEELSETKARVVPLAVATDPSRPIMYGIVLPGDPVAEGVLLVKGGNVERSALAPGDLVRVAPEIEAPFARARLQTDDVLITIRGSFGAVALVPGSITGANITQDTARIAPAADVSGRYLLEALRTPMVQNEIQARATGAGVRGLNIRDLKRIRLPMPSLEDQLRLTRLWDPMQVRADRLLAEAESAGTGLAEYRDALITEAVTGKLDVTRLSEQQMDESARAATEGESSEVLSA